MIPDNRLRLISNVAKEYAFDVDSSHASAQDIEPLRGFYSKIIKSGDPIPIARDHLKLYSNSQQFMVDSNDVKSLLPNVNEKQKKVLELFGFKMLPLNDASQKSRTLYEFNPRKYILATMINSVEYNDFKHRIGFAFEMYDEDEDGKISRKDLSSMLTAYQKDALVSLDEKTIDKIVNCLFQRINKSGTGLISFQEFQDFFKDYESKNLKLDAFHKENAKSYMNNTAFRLSDGRYSDFPEKKVSICSKIVAKLKIEASKWIWILIWILGNLGIMLWSYIEIYPLPGFGFIGFITVASRDIIEYNLSFILIFVSPFVLTLLRKAKLSRLLPLNFYDYFHAALGYLILAMTILHIYLHIAIWFPTLVENTPENNQYAYSDYPMHGLLWWTFLSLCGWTGWVCTIILFLFIVFGYLRKKYQFDYFYYTHRLWIIFFPLLLVHGSMQLFFPITIWKWLIAPFSLLLIEKTSKFISSLQKIEVVSINYLKSEVIELKIKAPESWNYYPGQYCQIKIPKFSLLQWHPFTISSSPADECITFHIAPVGDWTQALKEEALKIGKGLSSPKDLKVYITGPYGAPSQNYSNFKNLIVIATGVGATPFSSILRDIIRKSPEKKAEEGNFERIDFYWVNKKPPSYSWLSNLFLDMISLDEQNKRLLKIHMFFTGPQEKYDMRSFLLWTGMQILHSEGNKDFAHFDIMHWGRPEWRQIFRKKAGRARDDVGVFYCGNQQLANEIQQLCVECSSSGTVKFKFYKEIF